LTDQSFNHKLEKFQATNNELITIMPKKHFITEEITLTTLRTNLELHKRLEEITTHPDCFPVIGKKLQAAQSMKERKKIFDLAEYQDGKIYLLRDIALTPDDPKSHKNVVGYNCIFWASVDNAFDRKTHQVLKIGPSAVLPTHRNNRFVLSTSLAAAAREYAASYITGRPVDALIAAVNPAIRGFLLEVTKRATSGHDLEAQLYLSAIFIPLAASKIYPPHVDSSEFKQKYFDSSWVTPKPGTKELAPALASVHLIAVNKSTLWAAFYLLVQTKLWKRKTPIAHPPASLIEEMRKRHEAEAAKVPDSPQRSVISASPEGDIGRLLIPEASFTGHLRTERPLSA
jgi:hypothetical protein